MFFYTRLVGLIWFFKKKDKNNGEWKQKIKYLLLIVIFLKFDCIYEIVFFTEIKYGKSENWSTI